MTQVFGALVLMHTLAINTLPAHLQEHQLPIQVFIVIPTGKLALLKILVVDYLEQLLTSIQMLRKWEAAMHMSTPREKI